MNLVREQLARTRILAPFDGIIIEGDLSQSLGSPVERGETLFKIAPLDGYRIVLTVDEREIAYIEKGQKGALVLSSLPGKLFPLVVEKITALADAEKGYNAFRVEAALPERDVALRPGMQGIGKIGVGRATILWIWTHEMIDWFRLWLWSWWR
ncbi:MAG: HlyD family efflux transporter periplasmic adaptor subunit [Methylococcaceae bacterium]|nr:HlyD family efflux transporter periplasmic adaptor subunit [Methylococcaceae bacterium]MCI0732569.1 HlyD family efflux transporter periplasmic adaptor subunit [Methylococcaceae bacterium]